jgi:DNA-binding NarL/FixJ family response regulator
VVLHQPEPHARLSRQDSERTAVLFDSLPLLTVSTDGLLASSALAAGATAAILRTATTEDIVFAVRQSFERTIFLANPSNVPSRINSVAPAPSQIDRRLNDLTK